MFKNKEKEPIWKEVFKIISESMLMTGFVSIAYEVSRMLGIILMLGWFSVLSFVVCQLSKENELLGGQEDEA